MRVSSRAVRLWAISDLHLAHARNRAALEGLDDYGDDWLVVAGDVGEKLEQLDHALQVLTARFARVIWVPGNHDLWSSPNERQVRGEVKYQRLVAICRSHGVATPEDPFLVWRGDGGPAIVVPLFLLYDYTYRPNHISAEDVLEWSRASGVVCSDEIVLQPDPFPSREAWCAQRCMDAEQRLMALDPNLPTILVNHWPLRYDLVNLPRIPRFSPWCGTRRTNDWHQRFRARVVVYGHLHIRRTAVRDQVRFEEVSLGYPKQWDPARSMGDYLREILPGPDSSAWVRS